MKHESIQQGSMTLPLNLKCPEETLKDIGIAKEFLSGSPKSEEITPRIDQQNSELSIFCVEMETEQNEKEDYRIGEIFCPLYFK